MEGQTSLQPPHQICASVPPSSVSLTTQQLQDVITAAIAGALALQPAGTTPSQPKLPERPTVDLDYSEAQWVSLWVSGKLTRSGVVLEITLP